jgi:hypothetical protein
MICRRSRARDDRLADAAWEGLMVIGVAAGMALMTARFEAESTEIAGPKGEQDPGRAAVALRARKMACLIT